MQPPKKTSKPRFVKKTPEQSSVRGVRLYMGWLLARREYAASELRQKATHKGYTEEHIAEALLFVQKHGLQDDSRYAGMKARQSAGRYGDRHIQYALKAKKIAVEVAQEHIDELPAEEERAWRLVERFVSAGWNIETKQKAWKRLASRGFGNAAIKSALVRLETAAREAVSE